jgi:hypothetical protein
MDTLTRTEDGGLRLVKMNSERNQKIVIDRVLENGGNMIRSSQSCTDQGTGKVVHCTQTFTRNK